MFNPKLIIIIFLMIAILTIAIYLIKGLIKLTKEKDNNTNNNDNYIKIKLYILTSIFFGLIIIIFLLFNTLK